MGKYMKKSKPADEIAPSHSPLGVRTRARTLALAPPPSDYLQLRSRRLEKPPAPTRSPYQISRSSPASSCAGSHDVEVSFGDNVGDTGRDNRETTPCSLIRDSETSETPGSTNRPTHSTTARRNQNSISRNIPTTNEIEEFFSAAEQQQQRAFAEKYNFDPVNERPLTGRFDWVKLND